MWFWSGELTNHRIQTPTHGRGRAAAKNAAAARELVLARFASRPLAQSASDRLDQQAASPRGAGFSLVRLEVDCLGDDEGVFGIRLAHFEPDLAVFFGFAVCGLDVVAHIMPAVKPLMNAKLDEDLDELMEVERSRGVVLVDHEAVLVV